MCARVGGGGGGGVVLQMSTRCEYRLLLLAYGLLLVKLMVSPEVHQHPLHPGGVCWKGGGLCMRPSMLVSHAGPAQSREPAGQEPHECFLSPPPWSSYEAGAATASSLGI